MPRCPRAGGYVWGDSGSAACPANSLAITSAEACARAAAAMGKDWSADPTDMAERPSGCFWNEQGGTNVFFNTHVNGSGFPRRLLLCVVGASLARLMAPEGALGVALSTHPVLQVTPSGLPEPTSAGGWGGGSTPEYHRRGLRHTLASASRVRYVAPAPTDSTSSTA